MSIKIINSSHWSDTFIRRMLRWCIQQVEVPKGALRSAKFRKRTTKRWSGHAYPSGRIVVSVGDGAFPVSHCGYKRACRPADGSDYPLLADKLEVLIIVTAHELGHIAHFSRGHFGKGSEELADARARYTLRLFREQRESLVAAWSEQPAEKPKPSLQDQRSNEAFRMLANWERKLTLAKTKVAKYRRRVGYYERVAATKGGAK